MGCDISHAQLVCQFVKVINGSDVPYFDESHISALGSSVIGRQASVQPNRGHDRLFISAWLSESNGTGSRYLRVDIFFPIFDKSPCGMCFSLVAAFQGHETRDICCRRPKRFLAESCEFIAAGAGAVSPSVAVSIY